MSSPQDELRKSDRIVTVLLLMYMPVLLAVGVLGTALFHSTRPLAVAGIGMMATLMWFSVRRMIAFYRAEGKYPFYWLRPRK